VQQYESTAQMSATQLEDSGGTSQPAVSATPVPHSGCAHVPLLGVHRMLPHTLRTSATQKLSQLLFTQYGSTAAIIATHGSHGDVRATPVAHVS